MKKVYKIYIIEPKEVCIPSDDYYARKNDWQTESIDVLSFVETVKSEEEAIEFIEENIDSKREYIILPTYVK